MDGTGTKLDRIVRAITIKRGRKMISMVINYRKKYNNKLLSQIQERVLGF